MNAEVPSNLRNTVESIIRKAGDLVLSFLGKVADVRRKSDKSIVTEADVAVEKFLIENLQKVFFEAGFLAEESKKEIGKCKNEFLWVIDPIDGTTNFSHGLPYFSISVALTQHHKPIFGMVYNPILHELFYAERGRGAFMNGKPIRVSDRSKIDDFVVSIGVPEPCPVKDLEAFWIRFRPVQRRSYTYRKLGSAALDLAHVACGRLDGLLFGRLKWWDIAAGIVLVEEAGGVVSEFDEKKIGPGFASCLAANRLAHAKLQELLYCKSR